MHCLLCSSRHWHFSSLPPSVTMSDTIIGSNKGGISCSYLSNNYKVAPAELVKVKKERSKKATGAGTTAWTEQEYHLASCSWIKTSRWWGSRLTSPTLTANGRNTTIKWKMLKKLCIKTQVRTLIYSKETWFWSSLLLLSNSLPQRKRWRRSTLSKFYKRLRSEH